MGRLPAGLTAPAGLGTAGPGASALNSTTEVRSRRRAWAREKAAKLPVKILFPLVLFIFPPILALVLGPRRSR